MLGKNKNNKCNQKQNVFVVALLTFMVLVCSSGRAADLKVEISAFEHPYILFQKKDVARLAKRTQTPPYKYIWDNFTRLSPEKTNGVVNAFIYAVNGDVARGRAAHKVLADLCALSSWGLKPKLAVSGKCYPAGLIYDMIYDLLTPAERKTFSEKIANAGILRLYNDSFVSWWSHNRQHNYSPVFNAAYGIAAMAILKEKPEAIKWINRAADRTQLFLRSQDRVGGYGEGVNYWCMSLRGAFPFMDGLRNIFKLDLYREPYLTEGAGKFVLYCLSPDRRSTLNFNDAGINRKYDAHVMVRLASACNWSQIAWVINQDITGTSNVPAKGGEKPYKFSLGDIYSFLWYDPQVAQAPLENLPRSCFFPGIGWSVMRSGWDKDALQFGIISAPKFFGNHEHADRGSIILNAYGERLICDAGKPYSYGDPIIEQWFRGSAGHNLLFVNGKGQTMRENLSAPGRMSHFISTPDFDYVLTENSGPYGDAVKRWDRHAIFAVPEFIILYDQVELPEAGSLSFRYHSPGSRNILLQSNTAILPGDNAASIPSSSAGTRLAKTKFGSEYQNTEWWKSGEPLPDITEWTEDEKQTTDLLLQSFCLTPSQRQISSGYQDYRMPATYLSQSYQNFEKGDIITVLYPRSAEMKKQEQLPQITDLSNGSSLALKVVRGQNQHLIAASGQAKNVTIDKLFTNADFITVKIADDGSMKSCLMVNGTEMSYGTGIALNADASLLMSISLKEDRAEIVLDTTAPNGADLRIKLPKVPLAVLRDGELTFASITARNNLAAFHIPSGRSEVSIRW